MAQNTGKRIGVWIILGLLFVGLIGFGATGLSGTVRTLGKVGDKPIPVQRYATALSEEIRAFEEQIGQRIGFPMVQALGIDRQVLARLVSSRALDNEAARIGLSAGDVRVAEQVRRVAAFQGLDGSFDRDRYRLALQNGGLSEAEFETGLREDMARTLLQGAVIGGVPDATLHADLLAAYIGERRDPTWIVLGEGDLDAPVPDPTEDDLRAFYDANPDLFTAPEIRVIRYAWLTPAMIRDEVTVDEEALRELYDQRIDEFVQEERRLVERIIMPDAEAAAAARARLDAGETDFEGIVAARGLTLADTDMGDVTRDTLGAAGDAVFAAEPGAVIGPVDTSLGPAFFRMNAVLFAQEVPFEEARDSLRDELATARARRIIEDSAEALTDLIAGGAGIDDLAARSALETGEIRWSEGMTEGIAAYDAFRAAAAAAAPGALPELIELEDGGIFALELAEVIAPAVRPYDEVAAEVDAAWRAQETRTAILARAEALAQEVRETGRFRLNGRAAQVDSDVIRRNFIPGTPPGFIDALFEMQEGEVRVLPTETGAVVLRLDAIRAAPADDPTVTAERAAIADRIGQGIAQDLYAAFATAIQQRTEIRIDEAAVNAVHARFQ